jgi:hypothetical protein
MGEGSAANQPKPHAEDDRGQARGKRRGPGRDGGFQETAMTAEEFLRGLFESDRADRKYFKKHPPYDGDALVGARPWWPPLSQVWQLQGKPPSWDVNPHWPEAWGLLSELHAQYRATRGGKRE